MNELVWHTKERNPEPPKPCSENAVIILNCSALGGRNLFLACEADMKNNTWYSYDTKLSFADAWDNADDYVVIIYSDPRLPAKQQIG